MPSAAANLPTAARQRYIDSMKVTTGYGTETAFMLLFSLHRYARWVSSLKSTRPLSARAAGKEVQRLVELKTQFPELTRKIGAVLALHLELVSCLTPGKGQKQGLALQWPKFLNLATRQGEAVARLTACCEGMTLAAVPARRPSERTETDPGRSLSGSTPVVRRPLWFDSRVGQQRKVHHVSRSNIARVARGGNGAKLLRAFFSSLEPRQKP